MKKLSITAAFALAASAMTIAPTAALAQEGTSVQVTYEDLDLSTEGGVRELENRIDRAAKEICGDTARTGTRINNREARECVNEIKQQINAQFAELVDNARRGG